MGLNKKICLMRRHESKYLNMNYNYSGFKMKRILGLIFGLIIILSCGNVNAQVINTIAGNGIAGFSFDGVEAFSAQINNPHGIVIDTISGNIYFSDFANNRIRKVSSCGVISTIAGTGAADSTGDGGMATAAKLNGPAGLALDATGNLYFCDSGNNKIRKITTSGLMVLVAGTGDTTNGVDGVAATIATFRGPSGIVVDAGGNVYFTDQFHNRVRKISAAGIISNFAGQSSGISGSAGDGGAATAASLNNPQGLAIDAAGNIYVADAGNNKVRKISSGNITTIAGNGTAGMTGDGSTATAASLNNPVSVFVTATGTLFISDRNNNKIRSISSGIINTYAGTGTPSFAGDGGLASSGRIRLPYGVFGSKGNVLYFCDGGNNRIRKVFTDFAPVFSNGRRQSLMVCENSSWVSIDTFLKVRDTLTGQILSWSILLNSSISSLRNSLLSDTATGCSAILTPSGFTYRPGLNFTGSDSFRIKVTDGYFSDSTTIVVTINSTPLSGSIVGNTNICYPLSSTISETVSGGTWTMTNGNASMTFLSADSVIVASVVRGIDTLNYTVTGSNGCAATTTRVIDIVPYLSPISGFTGSYLCTGNTVTLTDSITSGCTWSTSDSTVARISPYGVVTPLAAGSANVYYTAVVCGSTLVDTLALNIYATPNSGTITGNTTICTGTPSTLFDGVTGGTWSSSNANATVSSSGVITAVSSGYDTILYTVSTPFCSSTSYDDVVIGSYAGVITGPATACIGATTTYLENVPSGKWYSSDTSIAKIDSISGVLTPRASGTMIVSYSKYYASCSQTIYATKTVTIHHSPSMPAAITGNDTFCNNSYTKLYDVTYGGTWASSNPSIVLTAKIPYTDTVILYSFANGGSSQIIYTITDSNCTSTQTVNVFVKTPPVLAPISGTSNLCFGSGPVTLSESAVGGAWSSSNLAVATVAVATGDSARVSPGAVGQAIISYSASNSCGTNTVSFPITVNPAPNAGSLSGTNSFCRNGFDTLSSTISGGSWFAANSNAIVEAPGVIYGYRAGIDTIKYFIHTIYCGNDTAHMSVTVKPLPTVGTITGNLNACTSKTDTLRAHGFSGSTFSWLSLHIDTATTSTLNDSVCVIRGTQVALDSVLYIVGNTCKVDTVYNLIQVRLSPNAGRILGDSIFCMGTADTLLDTTANLSGVWSESNNHIVFLASDTMASLTGRSAGIDTITYKVSSTYCGTASAVAVVDLKPIPGVGSISGLNSVCATKSITMSNTTYTNGTLSWYSKNPSIAGITRAYGIVTGGSAGVDSIFSVVTSTNCGADTAYKVITVNPQPNPGVISGIDSVCENATITLSDMTLGGKWSRSNSVIRADTVTVGDTVSYCYVKGLDSGKATVYYTATNVCGTKYDSVNIKVKSIIKLDPINGLTQLCKSEVVTYTDSVAGGKWLTTNKFVTIDKHGVARVDSVGIDTVLYTLSNFCNSDTVQKYIHVFANPSAGVITGVNGLCIGSVDTLVDTVHSGLWYSTNSVVALSSTGRIFGYLDGIDTIMYVFSNFCGTDTAKKIITVNPTPQAPSITTHSPSRVCLNSMYLNFGADTAQGNGLTYEWSVTNGQLFATGKDKQYCIVNFNDSVGTANVKLVVSYASGCKDSVSYSVTVGSNNIAPAAYAVYVAPEFFSLDSAGSYQWGYDIIGTDDSVQIAGQINQNYYNPSPDFVHYYYWVITSYGACSQKSYVNSPTGITNIVNSGDVLMKIYPNPISESAVFEVAGINNFEKAKLHVYDIVGRDISQYDVTSGSTSIDLHYLNAGSYVAVLEYNGFKLVSKSFIKY